MWGKEDEGENGRRGEWESGKASTTFATAFATAFAKLRRSRATVFKESFGVQRKLRRSKEGKLRRCFGLSMEATIVA